MRRSRFCTSPRRIWPFQTQLPDIVLVYCRFSHKELSLADFKALGFATTPPIMKAVPKRQSEFFAGRVCALSALRLLGRDDPPPAIGSNREPLWHESIIGSITHIGNVAAAAVSYSASYRGIGVDYEGIIAKSVRESLLEEILTENELSHYNAMDEEARGTFFTITFSIKESLFKALHASVGRHFGFLDACVTEIDHPHGKAKLKLMTTFSESWPAGTEFGGHFFCAKNHVGTLVVVC